MSNKCGVCSSDIKRLEKSISCNGLCERQYHLTCAKLREEELKIIINNKNVSWFCNNCNEMMSFKLQIYLADTQNECKRQNKTLISYQHLLTTIQQQVEELARTHREMKEEIKMEQKNEKRNYAEVVKNHTSVIIKPKAQDQNSGATRKEIKEKINPADIKAGITGIKLVKNGGIVVDCSDDMSSESIKKSIEKELGKKYEVTVAKLKKPKIKILGIDKDETKESIVKKIKDQNEKLKDLDIQILNILSPKNKRFNMALAEVTPEAYNKIMEEKKINIGWNRCSVLELINIYKCFNCSGYNHKASECKNKTACPKCAGNHALKDCVNSVSQCVNCTVANDKLKLNINTDHASWSEDA